MTGVIVMMVWSRLKKTLLGSDVNDLRIVVPTDARQRIADAADQLVSVADLPDW